MEKIRKNKINSFISPPALHEAQATTAYVLLMFYFFYYIALVISLRPIISTSKGLMFMKFAGVVEVWLYMNNLVLFLRSLKGRCCGK